MKEITRDRKPRKMHEKTQSEVQKWCGQYLPIELDIFHSVKINQKLSSMISTEQLNILLDDWVNYLICSQRIQGELNGVIITKIDSFDYSSSELLNEYHKSLFVEASSILAGNFISELDKNENIFSHLLPPVLFKEECREEKELYTKKKRFIQSIQNNWQKDSFPIVQYDLTYQDLEYSFDMLIFLTRTKLQGNA